MIRNRFLFIILLLFFTCLRLGIDSWSNSDINSPINNRNLLNIDESSDSNETLGSNSSIDTDDECDASEEEPEQSAKCYSKFDGTIGIVLYTAGVLYCFIGLAIICEGEFKDSVVEIARFLKLPPDVAGATLMAAGTSSPELFTSLVAIAGPVADIGTGTVVGSAIFNLLVIIGGCVLFSSYTFHLQWKPVLRDTIVNLISFIFLFVIFRDQLIHWYEAFIGCFLYVAYVAMMGVNTHIMNGMDFLANFAVKKLPFLKRFDSSSSNDNLDDGESDIQLLDDFDNDDIQLGDLDDDNDDNNNDNSNELVLDDDDLQINLNDDNNNGKEKPRNSIQQDADFEVAGEKHEHFPTSIIGWIWYVLTWPYEIVFHYTIPRVNGRFKYQFFATFILSLTWLGIFTTFMVKWTEKMGCILGIEDAIMGVTFLAVGTSMPDCLTSIFVARTGRGNMAICNALGSNIFDILLALSLPWALSTVITRAPVAVSSDSLVSDVLVLTGTLFAVFFSLILNRWRLNKKLGYFYYLLYIVFVTYTVMRELGLLNFIFGSGC